MTVDPSVQLMRLINGFQVSQRYTSLRPRNRGLAEENGSRSSDELAACDQVRSGRVVSSSTSVRHGRHTWSSRRASDSN